VTIKATTARHPLSLPVHRTGGCPRLTSRGDPSGRTNWSTCTTTASLGANDRHDHPQHRADSYPGLNHHAIECRSYGGFFEGWFEDARAGLDGPPGFLSAYVVRPFRFGEARWKTEDEDRLAIEFVPHEAGQGEPFRFSIPAGTIRSFAAHLLQTASVGDGWREPRRVRRSLID
jgi:hypothetical protein